MGSTLFAVISGGSPSIRRSAQRFQKTRPCLVLSTNAVNEHRRTVVVIPLSSSPSAYPPITVTVECEGLSSVAVV